MTARQVQLSFTVAGVDVAAAAVERVVVSWGRDDLGEQPGTATLTAVIDLDRAGWTTTEAPAEGARVRVAATLEQTAVEVFDGRIDEAAIRYDEATEHTHLRITADDLLAELAQTNIGDEPYPTEPAATRAGRIAPPGLVAGISWTSPTLAEQPERLWTVAARDIDRQPALKLLHEIAVSTDTAVYAGTDRRVVFHGLSLVHPGRVFVNNAGVWQSELAAAADVELSAAHLQADAEWMRARSQLVTDAVVRYRDELDPNAQPEIRRTRRAAGLSKREQRTTELAGPAEATILAERLIRRGVPAWHTDVLVWDADDGGQAAGMFALMDATARLGRSVQITGPPSWVPAEAVYGFVEGGTYSYVADVHPAVDEHPGRWVLGLAVVPAAGIGRGISYATAAAQHPAMTYTTIDPAITYRQARSIGDPINA